MRTVLARDYNGMSTADANEITAQDKETFPFLWGIGYTGQLLVVIAGIVSGDLEVANWDAAYLVLAQQANVKDYPNGERIIHPRHSGCLYFFVKDFQGTYQRVELARFVSLTLEEQFVIFNDCIAEGASTQEAEIEVGKCEWVKFWEWWQDTKTRLGFPLS